MKDNESIDLPSGQVSGEPSAVSRRDLALKLLAGAGLVSLASCAASSDTPDTPDGTVTQAISGSTAAWIDTVIGTSGTATAVTATSLTDSTKTWVTNQFAGETVTMGGKTGAITSNTATVLTISSWTGGTPALGTYVAGGLRSIVGSDTATTSKPTIIVGGYHLVGDGGGGVFYWDKASTAADNGGTIFTPTGTTTGRWVRIWSGYVDVRWFGAKGNNAGFDTAVGDADRIQAAIDFAAGVTTGGTVVATVFFSPGIYLVNDKLGNPYKLLLRSNVELLGCGRSSELRAKVPNTNNFSRMFSTDPAVPPAFTTNVTIRNLHINGQENPTGAENQRGGIFLDHTQDVRIINCEIHNVGDGVRFFGVTQRALVSGNNIHDIVAGRESINGSGELRDIIVENNHIHDSPGANAVQFFEGATHPAAGDYYSNVINGNVCKNIGGGILAAYGAVISNNVIEAVNQMGIQAGPSCQVIGNRIIKAIETGIQIYEFTPGSGVAYMEKLVIANNTITGLVLPSGAPYVMGIDLRGVPGATGTRGRSIMVNGNLFDNLTTAHMMGVRIEVFTSDISIADNQFNGAYYGIWLATGPSVTTSNIQMSHNTMWIQTGGTGMTYGQDLGASAFMQHVVAIGNIVRKVPGATSVCGINNGASAPTSYVLIGNDVSDTDTPYIGAPTGVGNIP